MSVKAVAALTGTLGLLVYVGSGVVASADPAGCDLDIATGSCYVHPSVPGGSSKAPAPRSNPGSKPRPATSGATTCTARDPKTGKPVTGPITATPVVPQPANAPPGEVYKHIYCGGVYLHDEWVAQSGSPGAGTSPADVIKQITFPTPHIHLNPDASHDQVVGLPTWMWVDGGDIGTVGDRATAENPTASQTVVASLTATEVEFDMGDGLPPVTCTGGDATTDPRPSGKSNCTHTYARSSAPRPGHPVNTYTVIAKTIWTGSYTVDGQPAGNLGPIPITSSITIHVAEAQSINN
jgi:hypothetical protein